MWLRTEHDERAQVPREQVLPFLLERRRVRQEGQREGVAHRPCEQRHAALLPPADLRNRRNIECLRNVLEERRDLPPEVAQQRALLRGVAARERGVLGGGERGGPGVVAQVHAHEAQGVRRGVRQEALEDLWEGNISVSGEAGIEGTHRRGRPARGAGLLSGRSGSPPVRRCPRRRARCRCRRRAQSA